MTTELMQQITEVESRGWCFKYLTGDQLYVGNGVTSFIEPFNSLLYPFSDAAYKKLIQKINSL